MRSSSHPLLVLLFVSMAGTVFCVSPGSGAVHDIIVRNFEFSPADLSVAVGDTVRWVWESGSHTTTSGASSQPADNPGALWDESITLSSPVFTRRFSDVGDFPYFCRPHEFSGMSGIVHVQIVTSVPGDGRGGEGRGLITALTAFPNPFSSSVKIGFELEREAEVSLEIFDLSGRLVRRYPARIAPAGFDEFRWDGRDGAGRPAAPGIYFLRLHAGREALGSKLIKAR